MRIILAVSFLAMLLALPVAALQFYPNEMCVPDKHCSKDNQEPEICEGFNGLLSFKSTKGVVQGSVLMQQWQIANDGRVEIPHRGLLIVHVRGGSLVTEIEGQRKEWSEDTFWTVAAGKRLVVYTVRDSVELQTVDFVVP
jgi:hypothetical protein